MIYRFYTFISVKNKDYIIDGVQLVTSKNNDTSFVLVKKKNDKNHAVINYSFTWV